MCFCNPDSRTPWCGKANCQPPYWSHFNQKSGWRCTRDDNHEGPCALVPIEQPMPVVNDRPSIQDQVIADIETRKTIGLQRYGTLLQPFNGRDALRDAYEEALDMCQYLKQALIERDGA